MSDSNLKKISGLWLKDGKKGKFMSGNLNSEALEAIADMGPCNLLVFKNDRKESDSQPDYQLFAAPKEDRGGGRQQRREEQNDDWP